MVVDTLLMILTIYLYIFSRGIKNLLYSITFCDNYAGLAMLMMIRHVTLAKVVSTASTGIANTFCCALLFCFSITKYMGD